MAAAEPQVLSDDSLRKRLNWATSKTVGGITEIAVLVPVKTGVVPLERRTYEERLLAVIDNLEDRHRRGLPTELTKIPAIHFGRLILIRPEQYMLYSGLSGVRYYPEPTDTAASGRVPLPVDDYVTDDQMPV